jgi:MFS transporter, FHS family, L-fucose permease
VASFFLNYATENAPYTAAEASNLLSYALIVFTISRFVATALATVFAPEFIMICYGVLVIIFNAYVVGGHGQSAVGLLIAMFFCEAPMYPTIFALGTSNLGRHTRRGAGILVMGVGGGAVFPPIQGAIADAAGTRLSYIAPLVGFIYVLGYVVFYWVRHGFQIRRLKVEQVVARSMSVSNGVVVFDDPLGSPSPDRVSSVEGGKDKKAWA